LEAESTPGPQCGRKDYVNEKQEYKAERLIIRLRLSIIVSAVWINKTELTGESHTVHAAKTVRSPTYSERLLILCICEVLVDDFRYGQFQYRGLGWRSG